MADIELVISISQEDYEAIKSSSIAGDMTIPYVFEAIRNGTPLQKGHGDLKDMDDIYEALEGWDDDTDWIVDAIDCQAQTIIEADRGEER